MNRFRILRIVLMMASVFVAGIGIGYRMLPSPTVPSSVVKMMTETRREVSGDTIVEFYDKELHLDESQKQSLRELAQPFITERATTKPGTKQRLAIFRAYFPRVRALLHENQLAKFDDITSHFRERVKQRAN